MNNKLKLLIILFILGMSGVLSLLTTDILGSLSEEQRTLALEQFSETSQRLLSLISPTILLLLGLIAGMSTYKKVDLSVPTLELISKGHFKVGGIIVQQLKYGGAFGIIAGILLVAISSVYQPYLPAEFVALENKLQPSLWVRFLYGGITEELILRFGLMSFLMWIGSFIYNHESWVNRWAAILIAAIIFGIGHLPIVYNIVEQPTTLLIQYIIIGNAAGGIVFGWLYWKKGLEAAIIAHMVTHIVLLLSS